MAARKSTRRKTGKKPKAILDPTVSVTVTLPLSALLGLQKKVAKNLRKKEIAIWFINEIAKGAKLTPKEKTEKS